MSGIIEAEARDPRISRLVTAVSQRHSLLGEVISTHGAASLGKYAREVRRHESYDPLQPRSEVVTAVVTEAQRTLGQVEDGSTILEKLRTQLERTPVFLTGNHHGPDFAASMHQGTRIFGLAADPDSIIPVLACGTVDLKSKLTRPSGILLANGRNVPVYSATRYGENTVTSTPPFTEASVDQTVRSISGQRGGKLTRKEADAIHEILVGDYLPTADLGLDSYADQSVVLNRRLWQRAHSSELDGRVPDLAFLELEGVTNQLLFKDLENTNTITYQSLFDRKLRNEILKNLVGVNGCWDNVQVTKVGSNEVINQEPSNRRTTFFWGIDENGLRYGFRYIEKDSKGYLVGTKKDGSTTEIELTEEKGPQAIIRRLQSPTISGDRIVPSLFTAYLEIAFAHGFKCEGGPKQIEYLTSMREGLVAALDTTNRHEWAEKVERVPTENYISGLAYAYANYPDDSTHRAGLVEVIANEGYSSDDLERMTSLSVEDSALPICARLYTNLYAGEEIDPELAAINEKVIYENLNPNAVDVKM